MTPALPARARPPWPAWALGFAAAVAGAAFLSLASAPVAQGWLVAFVFWSGIPVGSLVLLLIHRLTGGRWGERLAPALRPAASAAPLALLAFIPVAVGLEKIFPWAAHAGAVPPGVSHYLNAPLFLARAVLALGGWSILAVLVVQGRCTRLIAGLGLAFYGLTISLVSVDWILSIEPPFTSTAFAACIAIQQLLSALAFTALAAPEEPGDPATGDLAGLILAALLGVVYIAFMSYVVAWYGNLPEKAAWYLRRGVDGWAWTIGAAVALGAALPFWLLLTSRVRRSRRALRLVGALVLLGVWLHVVWLLAPAFHPDAIVAAMIALAVLAFLSLGFARGVAHRLAEDADGR